jgi:hypothetical protein
MATPATLAKHTMGTKIYVEDPDTPGSFIQAKECTTPPSVGDTAPLVKTTFSDALRETYITGRGDGDQPTLKFNFIPDDPGQLAIRGYKAAATNFQMRVVVPVVPELILGFEAVPLRAAIDPSNIDGQVVLEFIYKVNGEIDESATLS